MLDALHEINNIGRKFYILIFFTFLKFNLIFPYIVKKNYN